LALLFIGCTIKSEPSLVGSISPVGTKPYEIYKEIAALFSVATTSNNELKSIAFAQDAILLSSAHPMPKPLLLGDTHIR
jgi:hypothetical protein